MAIRSTLNVSLTPRLERFVESRVASGRYQTSSEVVREGLRLLEERDRASKVNFLTLKKRLQRATGQAERGEVADGDAFMDDLLARLKTKGRPRR